MDSVVSLDIQYDINCSHTLVNIWFNVLDGADSSVGSIDTIEVTPFPIQIHTGASLSILAQLTLAQEVPAGAKVKLDIKKEGLIPLPIPCLEIEGLHIGSW